MFSLHVCLYTTGISNHCGSQKRELESLELDSQKDRLIFVIKNQIQNTRMTEIHRFFEKGYSTKKDAAGHGLGLYNAKMLVGRYRGEITVSTERKEGQDYICIKVII